MGKSGIENVEIGWEKSSVSSLQDKFEKTAFNDACKEPQGTGSLNL